MTPLIDLISAAFGDANSLVSLTLHLTDKLTENRLTICDICLAEEARRRQDGAMMAALARNFIKRTGTREMYDDMKNDPEKLNQIFHHIMRQWMANQNKITQEQYENCIEWNNY